MVTHRGGGRSRASPASFGPAVPPHRRVPRAGERSAPLFRATGGAALAPVRSPDRFRPSGEPRTATRPIAGLAHAGARYLPALRRAGRPATPCGGAAALPRDACTRGARGGADNGGAGSTAERDSDRRRRGRVAGMGRIARRRHVSVPSCVGLLGAGEHELAHSPDSAERDQWLSVGTHDRTDQRRGLCVRDAQEGRPEHQPDGQRDGYADGHILPGARPHGAKAGLDRVGHDEKAG